MLNKYARAFATKIFTPVARFLLRLGVTPDMVTIAGTLGVLACALVLYPLGELFWGSLGITIFVLSDTIDGTMARILGRSGKWGAYLDSSLDRFADAAIFGGLVLWFALRGDDDLTAVLALACLVTGSLVSYVKARAEGLGYTANVGIAERGERLIAVLVGAGFVGLGVPLVFLQVVLGLLAVASVVTIGQRMTMVRRQALVAPQE